MKHDIAAHATLPAEETARHLGSLLRQRRLARQWTLDELAERARIGTATLKRMEKGAPSVSLGIWLSVYESLGLIGLFQALTDPSADALLDRTRPQRARRKTAVADLDF